MTSFTYIEAVYCDYYLAKFIAGGQTNYTTMRIPTVGSCFSHVKCILHTFLLLFRYFLFVMDVGRSPAKQKAFCTHMNEHTHTNTHTHAHTHTLSDNDFCICVFLCIGPKFHFIERTRSTCWWQVYSRQQCDFVSEYIWPGYNSFFVGLDVQKLCTLVTAPRRQTAEVVVGTRVQ